MAVYNKHKDNPYIATYELYHWEAHPSQYDDSHEFNEVPGDWWYQQPFTKPSGLEHRIEHHDCYKEAYPEVTIPCLIDDGRDGSSPCYLNTQCVVSKKFKAMYTSIVTIGLDGKVAFAAHWPPELSGNWTDAQAKQWVQREYPAWGDALDSLLAAIDTEAPEVAVTSPSGGEELDAGTTHSITWTANDNVGVVSRAIYLTTDGSTWELVDSAGNNTGSYSWTVPDNASNTCKIKVYAYDAMGNAGNAESGTFSIASTGIIDNPVKAKQLLTVRKNAGSYSVYSPFSGNYLVAVTDVCGKQLASFTTSNGSGWYTVPGSLSAGMYMVSIRTPEKTIVSKIWFLR